jgi:hypothetical protein
MTPPRHHGYRMGADQLLSNAKACPNLRARVATPRMALDRMGAALLLAILFGLGACQNTPAATPEAARDSDMFGRSRQPRKSEPLPPSFEPIQFSTGGGSARRGELQEKCDVSDDAAGWKEKWELASRYAAGGYDQEALQVLDGALAQSPPPAWSARLRGLRHSLTIRRAEELLLRVEARGVKDYVGFGCPVDFVIRLRNVSGEVLSIVAPATGSGSSPSALLLEIRRRDRDVHATQLGRTWNQTVFLQKAGDAPIVIQPGQVHELPVRIPAEAAGAPIAGIRTLELTGTLRPTDLRRGTQRRRVTLPVRAGRVIALPGGFEPLTVDPLKSMGTAIDTVAPAHLLIAAEFVPPSRRAAAFKELARALGEGHPALYRAALGAIDLLRERAVGLPVGPFALPLVDQLSRSPERVDALMEGLSTVTGVRLAPDARLWQDWYRKEANRRRPVPASDTP